MTEHLEDIWIGVWRNKRLEHIMSSLNSVIVRKAYLHVTGVPEEEEGKNEEEAVSAQIKVKIFQN